MDLRRPLIVLVSGLFVFVVAFAVLSAASSFSSSIGDADGALWLWRLAIGCLLLLLIDGLLLLAVLGLNALDGIRRDGDEPIQPERSGFLEKAGPQSEIDRDDQ